MIAEFIAHYRIIEKLGQGGMGEVYLAQDTKLDRKVAIKVLPADSVADETAKKRLIREAQAAAKLDHPNICAIYEVNEADSVTFIVMQYIEGESLAEKLKKKKLKLSTALDVARQTAEALAEAHAHGIVHRDIKPQNIMITRRDQVKILDFGLSKQLQTKDDVDNEAPTKSLLSTPGHIMGTIPYMSPEQVSGDTLDASSDIFSLGVTFYEMMSGKHPFKGKTNTVTMSQILLAEPVPSERLKTRTSPELQQLLAKMLSKKKEERYQSATELLADLKQLPAPVLVTFDETQSIAVPLPSSTKELSGVVADDSGAGLLSKVARYKWALIGLLAVAVAAVGIRAYFLSPKVDSLAILPFTYTSSDSQLMANHEYLSDGFTDSVISNLAQLKDMKVIARSSVFHYQGKELGPQAIGRELNVRAVLVGHIQQEGDELTIKAELLDVEDNSQLWLGNYPKRKLADSQAIQEDIAKNIAAKLRVKFGGADQTRPKTYTENSEAYQAYLKGRYHWNKRSDEGFKQAIKFFEEAKDKDPKYALAYSGLADCYTLRSDYGFMSPTDGYALAKTWAGIALQYDESLAEAHTSLASIIAVKDWDWHGAEREYLKAIELNPNYATAHHWYATQLLIQGKLDQALVEIKKALQLDPLSLGINKDFAVIQLYMGDADKALAQCRDTLELKSDFLVMFTYIAQALQAKQKFAEAISELEKARAASPEEDREINYGLAQAYALSGRWDEARKLADQLSQSTKENMDLPKEAAFLYLSLGEKDKAVSILQKAYENHHISVAEVKTDPRFKSLQTDPRVVEILRNIGLSQ